MISEHNAKQRCQWLITAMVGKELADVWWSTPNRAFDMHTPAGIWLEDYLKVYKYLMARAGE